MLVAFAALAAALLLLCRGRVLLRRRSGVRRRSGGALRELRRRLALLGRRCRPCLGLRRRGSPGEVLRLRLRTRLWRGGRARETLAVEALARRARRTLAEIAPLRGGGGLRRRSGALGA